MRSANSRSSSVSDATGTSWPTPALPSSQPKPSTTASTTAPATILTMLPLAISNPPGRQTCTTAAGGGPAGVTGLAAFERNAAARRSHARAAGDRTGPIRDANAARPCTAGRTKRRKPTTSGAAEVVRPGTDVLSVPHPARDDPRAGSARSPSGARRRRGSPPSRGQATTMATLFQARVLVRPHPGRPAATAPPRPPRTAARSAARGWRRPSAPASGAVRTGCRRRRGCPRRRPRTSASR